MRVRGVTGSGRERECDDPDREREQDRHAKQMLHLHLLPGSPREFRQAGDTLAGLEWCKQIDNGPSRVAC